LAATSRIFLSFQASVTAFSPTPDHFNTAATSFAHSLKIRSCRIVFELAIDLYATQPSRSSARAGNVITFRLKRGQALANSRAASLRLDVEGPDDVAPLLGFLGDELAKVGGRTRKHGAVEIGKPRLDLGIGEAGIDLLVELVDDFGGRAPRSPARTRRRSGCPAASPSASRWSPRGRAACRL